MKTLVLGGYGNFGGRICHALSADANIELLVAGRNAERAHRFADALQGRATGISVDCAATDFSRILAALDVDLVIHTAGPFQEQSYGVALAAAAAGAHYIDLADGRRFVCEFPAALQDPFSRAGKTAISGASTVPALSSAVVEHLCAGWRAVHAIDICIAPAQMAPRGKATLAGVLSYCGKPVRVWRGGKWTQEPGWARPERVEFKRMRPRLGALCDIPDLGLFPERYGVRDRVMFRAALEVTVTQRAFALLAALGGKGLLKRPERLAGVLDRTSRVFDRLGSPLGGMVVRVEGLDHAGCTVQRAWHIAADNDHGPEIPCMATILLARKLAAGVPMETGAFTAAGLLSLHEFEPEFARWGMVTDIVDEAPAAAPGDFAAGTVVPTQ